MPDSIGTQIAHDVLLSSGLSPKDAQRSSEQVRKCLQKCSLEAGKAASAIPNKNRVSDTCMRLTLRGGTLSYRGMSVQVPPALQDLYHPADDAKSDFKLLRMWNVMNTYHLLGDFRSVPYAAVEGLPEATQECFASPLSHRASKYNSVAEAYDRHFGSKGSFYLQVREGG